MYSLPLERIRGSSLADFDIVGIPVALNEEEQKNYDECSKLIRHFMTQKCREQPGYSWKHLCNETGADPQARQALKAYYLKQSIEDRAEEKLRVLEDIFRLHVGQSILVFTGSNAMAVDISLRFLAPTILSHTRKKERLVVLAGFAAMVGSNRRVDLRLSASYSACHFSAATRPRSGLVQWCFICRA